MRKHIGVILVGMVIVVGLILYAATFTVRWQEKALVLTMGKITAEIDKPGLNWKWPVFQSVMKFDSRIRTRQLEIREVDTSDQQTVIVGVYVNWRIKDARVFYNRFFSKGESSNTQDVIAKAEDTMDKWIADATNVLAEYKLGELVTLNKSQFKLAAVESGGEDGSDGMLQRVRAKAASGEGHGIEILDIGIRKMGVPDNVSTAVFERMKQNRTAEARRLVTQGQGEADMIVGTAEAEARGIMARANAEARKIQGEGDAAAAEYYTTFLDNPTLANFLRRLQTLRETLSERTTIILDSGTPPYQLLTAEPTIGGSGAGQ